MGKAKQRTAKAKKVLGLWVQLKSLAAANPHIFWLMANDPEAELWEAGPARTKPFPLKPASLSPVLKCLARPDYEWQM